MTKKEFNNLKLGHPDWRTLGLLDGIDDEQDNKNLCRYYNEVANLFWNETLNEDNKIEILIFPTIRFIYLLLLNKNTNKDNDFSGFIVDQEEYKIKDKLRNNLNVQHIAKSIIKNQEELNVVVDIFSCIERNKFDDRAESLWFFCKEYVRFLIDSELKKIK